MSHSITTLAQTIGNHLTPFAPDDRKLCAGMLEAACEHGSQSLRAADSEVCFRNSEMPLRQKFHLGSGTKDTFFVYCNYNQTPTSGPSLRCGDLGKAINIYRELKIPACTEPV